MILRNRLSFTVVPLIVLWANLSSSVIAKTTCQSTPNGQLCTSEVDTTSFRPAIYGPSLEFDRLPPDQRSWTACLSFLYRYYEHPVRAARLIMGRTRSWTEMAELATRRLVDDRHKTFRSRVKTMYDFDDRIPWRSNVELIKELDEDRPVILVLATPGSPGVAVLLIGVQYYVTPTEPRITAMGVVDPLLPQRVRGLNSSEMVIRDGGGQIISVAFVKVESPETQAPQSPPAPLAVKPTPTPLATEDPRTYEVTIDRFDQLNEQKQKEILRQQGPLFPTEFNPAAYSMRAFVKGRWRVLIDYALEVDSSVTVTIKTKEATFSQAFTTTPTSKPSHITLIKQDGTSQKIPVVRKQVEFILPDNFGNVSQVAAVSFRALKNGREVRGAVLRIYALAMRAEGENAVNAFLNEVRDQTVSLHHSAVAWQYSFLSGTIIDQISFFGPLAIQTYRGEKFTYQFHSRSDLNRLSAIFFLDYVDASGVLAARQVHSERLRAIRRDEWSPQFYWDGRSTNGRVSKGPHQLQLRGWTASVRDGSWVTCAPDLALRVDF
jgi:hypothetical protein